MTIQIDDAGWGSLIDGALVGACRKESPRIHAFREVPVQAFQPPHFEDKQYLGLAALAVLELVIELNVPKDEPIHICTGYMLTEAIQPLITMGYQVTPTKIGEPLQTLIETELFDRISALGVETTLDAMTTEQGKYFYHCLLWLKCGDINGRADPRREAQCKTGWASYRIWADNPYYIAKQKAAAFKSARRRNRWQSRME